MSFPQCTCNMEFPWWAGQTLTLGYSPNVTKNSRSGLMGFPAFFIPSPKVRPTLTPARYSFTKDFDWLGKYTVSCVNLWTPFAVEMLEYVPYQKRSTFNPTLIWCDNLYTNLILLCESLPYTVAFRIYKYHSSVIFAYFEVYNKSKCVTQCVLCTCVPCFKRWHILQSVQVSESKQVQRPAVIESSSSFSSGGGGGGDQVKKILIRHIPTTYPQCICKLDFDGHLLLFCQLKRALMSYGEGGWAVHLRNFSALLFLVYMIIRQYALISAS